MPKSFLLAKLRLRSEKMQVNTRPKGPYLRYEVKKHMFDCDLEAECELRLQYTVRFMWSFIAKRCLQLRCLQRSNWQESSSQPQWNPL